MREASNISLPARGLSSSQIRRWLSLLLLVPALTAGGFEWWREYDRAQYAARAALAWTDEAGREGALALGGRELGRRIHDLGSCVDAGARCAWEPRRGEPLDERRGSPWRVTQALDLPAVGPGWLVIDLPWFTGLRAALGAVVLMSGLLLVLWLGGLRQPLAELRRRERVLRQAHASDAMTGLLSRVGLLASLDPLRERARAARPWVGAVVFDIDRFSLLNEALGPVDADQILRNVASRVQATTRESDRIARVAGDQFVVLVGSLAGPEPADALARNLLRALLPPYVIGGKSTRVGFSVGVAAVDSRLGSLAELIKNAELAMRAAKHEGGGRLKHYDPAMADGLHRRMEVEVAVRRAVEAGEFKVHYQPIMSVDGLRVEAVEALLRWDDGARLGVDTASLIKALETTGLIHGVGLDVLEQACRQALLWSDAGHPRLVLSVNVSALQFDRPDLARSIFSVIERTGFAPRNLQLELTENLLLDPSPTTVDALGQLSARGVRLALDDFGIGYSSLAYLKRFNLTVLKIDREFVRDMVDSSRDVAIVRAVIDLGHALDMHVIAEGVETSEQLETLAQLDCDSIQGFLFGAPMDVARCDEFLAAYGQAPAMTAIEPTVSLAA
ncbi:MAG: bifunctional diguanylate cyclase/phosphodiesterase [Burkholderiaceae bacterium]